MTKALARKKRGQASQSLLNEFHDLSDNELILRLRDDLPDVRAAAALQLGQRKCVAAVVQLCFLLETESALYPRINASKALAEIGAPSLDSLILLLGKIGDVHRELPAKGFYKKSYPLPRDLAVRTIVRTGPIALNQLNNVIKGTDRNTILEAIDGIGHISFYHDDTSSEQLLVKTYQRFQSDELVKWKIIRAFQAFSSPEVKKILGEVLDTSQHPAHRWEAARSLALMKSPMDLRTIAKIKRDENKEVRKIINFFVRQNSS